MLFGEIVEPTTRALIDDDSDYFEETTEETDLGLDSGFVTPKNIKSLIFVENSKLINFFSKVVIANEQPYCSIKNVGIEVYKLENDTFVVLYKEQTQFTAGEIVENFKPWIRIALKIYAITSDCVAKYQDNELLEKPECIIRSLSTTKQDDLIFDRLRSPNVVTGLGASVLSYCVNFELICNLYIIYLNPSSLDFIDTKPIFELLSKLHVPLKTTNVKLGTIASNLYM